MGSSLITSSNLSKIVEVSKGEGSLLFFLESLGTSSTIGYSDEG